MSRPKSRLRQSARCIIGFLVRRPFLATVAFSLILLAAGANGKVLLRCLAAKACGCLQPIACGDCKVEPNDADDCCTIVVVESAWQRANEPTEAELGLESLGQPVFQLPVVAEVAVSRLVAIASNEDLDLLSACRRTTQPRAPPCI